jgi:two-component system, NtrC family, sensor histidine kinase GlrK
MELRYPKSFLSLLLVGFLIVALPLILGLLSNAWSIERLSEQSQKAVYNAAQATQASRALASSVNTMERYARQYAIFNDPAFLDGYRNTRSQFLSITNQFAERPLTPPQRQAVDEIIKREAALNASITRSTPSPDMAQMLGQEFAALSDRVLALNTLLNDLIDHEVESLKTYAAKSSTQVLWQVLAMVPSALIMIAGFTYLLSAPIRDLDKAIHRLGEGKLSKRISVTGPADIAHLGEQLDWLRQRLISLEDQKTRFLQHVSHELKTPLTALREGSDLLSDEVVGKLTAEQKEVAQILKQNSLTLEKLIEDLLHHSATHGSRAGLDVKSLQLRDIIEQVVSDQKMALVAKNLLVDLHCDKTSMQGDPDKLRVVIDNLLSNAVKYSPNGGVIQIRLGKEDENAIIEVIDQGPGIAPEDSERIFDPFYRGKSGVAAKGTGLGLAIVKDYVEMHRGTVRLIDVTIGRIGAHFKVTLPKQAKAGQA